MLFVFFRSPLILAGLVLRQLWLRMLTGLVVGQAPASVHAKICARPVLDQASLVGGTLVALALATSLFAEAGPGGPIAMWATLLFLIR